MTGEPARRFPDRRIVEIGLHHWPWGRSLRVRTIAFVALLTGLGAGSAGAVSIGSIQSYDAVNGVPDSPYIGQSVTLVAEVSVPDGILGPDVYFITDASGGIMVRSDNAGIGGSGYLIRVIGVVSVADGEIYVDETSVQRFVSGPTLVRPTETEVGAIAADFGLTGSLLRSRGVAAAEDSLGFDLTWSGETVRVAYESFTGVGVGAVQDGDAVAVTGALRIVNGQPRLVPRNAADLLVSPPNRPYLLQPDGSGSFPDLAAALAFTVPGDTLTLAAGTYLAHDLLMAPEVLVRSADGNPASVVIDAGGLGRVFEFRNGPAAALQGLTLTGGQSTWGGAVLVTSSMGKVSTFVDCILVENTAEYGGAVRSEYARPEFVGCEFRRNSAVRGGGVDLDVVSNKSALIAAGWDMSAGNPNKTTSQPTFTDCVFDDNSAGTGGAFNLHGLDGVVPFTACTFIGNTATGRGGAGFLSDGTEPTFESCLMSGNEADDGGDVFHFASAGHSNPVLIRNCSIVANGQPGGTLLTGGEANITIETSVIAFNGSGTLVAVGQLEIAVSCSDIYGNAGGDWLGPLAAFAATDSNFSANPLFCELAGGDYELAANSPCLPGNHPAGADCGLIGAEPEGTCGAAADQVAAVTFAAVGKTVLQPGHVLGLRAVLTDAGLVPTLESGVRPTLAGVAGLGVLEPLRLQSDRSWRSSFTAGSLAGRDTLVFCDPDAVGSGVDTLLLDVTFDPIINSVLDIPDDQGRQVRVRWQADTRDVAGSPAPILQYVVWRKVPGTKAGESARILKPSALTVAVWQDSEPWLLELAQALWEPVGPVVPGMMWPEYASVVPTLVDSTAAAAGYSTFFVSAHTAAPQTFFTSLPDSGYSVDNIAPAAPSNLSVVFDAGLIEFVWDANTEPDLESYRVYRGLARDFQAPNGDLVAAPVMPTWSMAAGGGYYYRVTAVDHAGNESPSVLADAVTAVAGQNAAQWVLHRNVPNPFNPSTKIAFETPVSGAVDLEIFDVRGRLVRTLLAGQSLSSGHHEYTWNGIGDNRAPVASGVYLVRVRSGSWSATGRMTLAK